MKLKVAILIGVSVTAFGVLGFFLKREPVAPPSAATLKLRASLSVATEARLYTQVIDPSCPDDPENVALFHQSIATKPAQLILREAKLKSLVAALDTNHWFKRDTSACVASSYSKHCLIFFRGSQPLADLRYYSNMMRYYNPTNYAGDGQTTSDCQQYLTGLDPQ